MSKENELKSIPKFLTPWSPIRRVPGTHLVESEEALEEKARAFDAELDRLESLGIPRMVEQGPTPELMGQTIRPYNYVEHHGAMIYNPAEDKFDYVAPTIIEIKTKKPGEIDWINNPVTLAWLLADLGRLGVKGAIWALPRVLGRTPMGKAMLIRNMMSSTKPNFTPNPGYTRIVLPNGKVRFRLPSHTDALPREFTLEPIGDNKYNMHMRIWDDPANQVAGSITPQERDMLLEAVSNELPVGAELAFPTSTSEMLGTRGTAAIAKRFRTPESIPGNGIWEPGAKGSFLYVRDPETGAVGTVEGNGWVKTGNKNVRFELPQSPLYLRYSAKHLLPEDGDIVPVYTGLTHSVNEILNADNSINFEKLEQILNENADFWSGNRIRARTENPKWHKTDPTTYYHTLNVIRSAWGMPVPEGYTRRQFSLASALHDAGKMFAGEGHDRVGAAYFKLVFPDMDDAVYNAIYYHTKGADDALTQAVKAADIDNGTHMARISEAERLGIPKGERNNITLSRELSPSLMSFGFRTPDARAELFRMWRSRYPNAPIYKPSSTGSYMDGSGMGENWLTVARLGLTDENKALMDYYIRRLLSKGIDPKDTWGRVWFPDQQMANVASYPRAVNILKNRTDAKLGIPVDESLKGTTGLHITHGSGQDELLVVAHPWRAKPYDYSLFHEGFMHPTENFIFRTKIPNDVKGRTFGDLYRSTAYPIDIVDPKIISLIYKNPNSVSSKEVRAMTGEFVKKLTSVIAEKKGMPLEKVLQDLSLIEEVIDKNFSENPSKFISFLRSFDSSYANDWANLLGSNLINDELRSKILKRFIGSLKYLPIVFGAYSTIPINYSDELLENTYKTGGSIHIKKKNRGKFTASAKKAGESVQEHAHKIINNPNASTLLKKRALFAINSRKWSKH